MRLSEKKINELIEERLVKFMKEWTLDINMAVNESRVKKEDWTKHAQHIEEHGKQIERFLTSFEGILKELLRRSE